MRQRVEMLCLTVLVATALSLAGCGSGSPPVPESPAPTVDSADQLKSRLQGIAESGTTGSALAGMPEAIGQVADEAKQKALLAEYKKLEQAQSPEAAKKIAAAMLGML